jgi:hypothetical protein
MEVDAAPESPSPAVVRFRADFADLLVARERASRRIESARKIVVLELRDFSPDRRSKKILH